MRQDNNDLYLLTDAIYQKILVKQEIIDEDLLFIKDLIMTICEIKKDIVLIYKAVKLLNLTIQSISEDTIKHYFIEMRQILISYLNLYYKLQKNTITSLADYRQYSPGFIDLFVIAKEKFAPEVI